MAEARLARGGEAIDGDSKPAIAQRVDHLYQTVEQPNPVGTG
jgi:hypothetical protein